MEELLLINPSKRRGKRRSVKRRSPAQRAATARLVAANRSKRRVHHRKARTVFAAASNPVRRRRARRHTSSYRSNPVRRYRRNPSSAFSGILPMITDAATGAAGALAVDVAVKYLPVPETLKTGATGALVKAGAAVALGAFGGAVLPRRVAKQMAAGSLTVTAYQTLKGFVSPLIPGGLGYYSPGAPALAMRAPAMNLRSPAPAMTRNTLSEYVRKSELQGVGEYY